MFEKRKSKWYMISQMKTDKVNTDPSMETSYKTNPEALRMSIDYS